MKHFLAKTAAFIAIFGGLFSFIFSLSSPVHATVMGVFPGDLIKLKDDKNPATTEDKVVYYFDKEWFRRPFPNQRVFESWYRDFSGVKELTKEEMADIRLGKPIVYRPGTRLVKVPSIPKVYAVEPDGMLRWIESETVAKSLFGNDWAKRVDDVQEAFFINYKEGAPLTAPVYPTGSVLRKSDGSLFITQGLGKRFIPPTLKYTLRVREADIIPVADDVLADYADRGDISVAADLSYVDTAQYHFVDVLSPPVIDFPANVDPLVPGANQALAVLRITNGAPAILRRVKVTISGPLWSGSTPNLTDIHFVDVQGNDLFGIQQLETPGSSQAVHDFQGAYTMLANTTSIVELRATSSAAIPKGSTVTVAIDRSAVSFAEGTSGNPLADFYPKRDFSAVSLEVK